MKICYFGIYDPAYSRNRILIHGLEKNNSEVVLCRIDPKEYSGIKKYWKLFWKAYTLRKEKFDYIFVGFPGQSVVWIAALCFNAPIVFDAFLSLYDSNVNDRKKYGRYSLGAFRDFFFDFFGTHSANFILVDTNEHRKYFATTFKTPMRKLIRVFVGAQEDVFYPRPRLKPAVETNIYFHGNFIPLQGVKYILEAATLLRNEKYIFTIIGTGQEYAYIEKELQNRNLETTFKLLGRKTLEELAEAIRDADICLGIFGQSAKTRRVIPNKVYEYAAMAKPIITADTPAVVELFKNKENVLLCKAQDGEDLAKKIVELANNRFLQQTLGDAARQLFEEKLTSKKIVDELLIELAERK